MGMFEFLGEVRRATEARDRARAAQLPKQITAAALVADGPAAYARELDEIFDREGGLYVRQRWVLGLTDKSVRRRDRWSTVPHVDSREGGFEQSVDVAMLLENFGGAPEWYLDHMDARVIAFVDGKAHLFVRDGGAWHDGAAFADALREKAAEKAATERVAYEAARAESARLEAEREAAAKASVDAAMARIEARSAEREARAEQERAEAEQRRIDNLVDVTSDPTTLVTVLIALDLLADDGTLRPLVREEDLAPRGHDGLDFGAGVRATRTLVAALRAAVVASDVHVPRSDMAERVVAHLNDVGRGRTSIVANLGHPYGRRIEVRFVAWSDGKRTVLTTEDERVPLHWRGV